MKQSVNQLKAQNKNLLDLFPYNNINNYRIKLMNSRLKKTKSIKNINKNLLKPRDRYKLLKCLSLEILMSRKVLIMISKNFLRYNFNRMLN